MSEDWRQVVAAMANPTLRTVYAEVVLGLVGSSAVPLRRRTRALETLEAAGLVVRSGESWAVTTEHLDGLLAEREETMTTGIERFMRNGRIDRYPAKRHERRVLLEWVANRALRPGEDLSEPEMNVRLEPFATDVIELRRYLIDAELVERTPSGSSYALIPASERQV